MVALFSSYGKLRIMGTQHGAINQYLRKVYVKQFRGHLMLTAFWPLPGSPEHHLGLAVVLREVVGHGAPWMRSELEGKAEHAVCLEI